MLAGGQGLRLAGILIGSVALAYLTLAVGIASTLRNRAPDMVMRWTDDSRALSRAAELRLTNQQQGDTAAAGQLARRALARDLTVASAVRTLALVADQQQRPDQARTLINYSARLSKRDLPTRLWLIEQAVQRNQVGAALEQYDIALRTSRVAEQVLFPVLIKAIDDPEIRTGVVSRLTPHPVWREDFILAVLAKPEAALSTYAVARDLAAHGSGFTRPQLIQLIGNLVNARNFQEARVAYRLLTGLKGWQAPLNGGFDRALEPVPFDWLLTDSAAKSAERVREANGDWKLQYRASGDQGGELARQLLLLRPGSYRLTGEGRASSERPARWMIYCFGSSSAPLVEQPAATATGRYAAEFAVPASGCEAQWLMLIASSQEDSTAVNGWVDKIAIN